MSASEIGLQNSPDIDVDLLFVPIGSLEQHGPHLPLLTDGLIAAAVADRLVERARGAGIRAAVAPLLPYGASGEHEGFPGTISIGTDALTTVLLEIGRSACRWASKLIFVNGHGGNVEALRAAVGRLRDESRDVAWLACVAPTEEGDLHAGHLETSLIAHLHPSLWRSERAELGAVGTARELIARMRAGGVRAVSPNGIIGDPRSASAEDGASALDAMTRIAWSAAQNTPDSAGYLRGTAR